MRPIFFIYLFAIRCINRLNPLHMKPYSLIFFVLLACVACKRKPDPIDGANKPYAMALVIGNPIRYDDTANLLMFPIGANYNPQISKKPEPVDERNASYNFGTYSNRTSQGFVENHAVLFDKAAKQEYVNENSEDFDIRNILFYHKRSGMSYILSKDTLHILSFAIHNEFDNPLIFYRVVKVDINKDKKYNSSDAVMLYVSKTDGTALMQITPADEQFFDYFYYPETQSVLIKTAYDIDGDKKFTELDETNFREMRLSQPAFGREIFPKDLKDSLKKQISVFK